MSICGYARLFVLFILHGSFILHLGAYLYYAVPFFRILGCNQHLMAEDKIRKGVLWNEDIFDNGECRHIRSMRIHTTQKIYLLLIEICDDIRLDN